MPGSWSLSTCSVSRRRPCLFWALLYLAFLAAGTGFYLNERDSALQVVTNNLHIVVNLKVEQVAAWRRERLADATEIAANHFFADTLESYLEHGQPELQRRLKARLHALNQRGNFRDIWLFDAQGQSVALPGFGETPGANARLEAAVALHHRNIAISELHIDGDDGDNDDAHIDAVAPLVGSRGQLVGTMILHSWASDGLYPLIDAWPAASTTAETLLVKRDGDDALFLGNARHQPHAPLRQRIPLTQTEVPAVQAVLGTTGIFSGKDYRGERVVSVLAPVPDSDWFLVGKIDEDEAYADWRTRSRLILTLLALLTLGFAALPWWLRRQAAQNAALFKVEAELRESNRELRDDREHQEALREIRECTVGSGSLARILECCLDRLLAVSWLSLLPKGGIHLAAAQGDGLDLSVARNLPPELLAECAHLPAHRCLCGLAAASRQVVFADRCDERHEIRYPGMPDHAHWCLPLLADGQMLGVLMLNLPAGSTRKPRHEAFLRAAADVIASCILHKRAELMLSKLSSAVEQSSSAIVITNQRNEIEFVNLAFTRITGYAPDEVLGKNPRMLASGMTPRTTYDAIWASLAAGESWSGELINRRRDGRNFVARQTISPIRQADGEIGDYVSVFEDFTDFKRIADELAMHREHLEDMVAMRTAQLVETEAFVRTVTDNTDALIGYWDSDLRCRFANRHYNEWFGRKPEDMIGMRIQDLLGATLFARNEPLIRAALAGEPQEFERVLTKADGSTGHILAHYIPDRVDGVVRGFFVTVTDVTMLKSAELQLAERTADMERAQRISHSGSWQLDIASRLFTGSDETSRIFGLPLQQPVPCDTYFDIVHPDDHERVHSAWRDALQGRGDKNYESEHRIVVDGQVKWLRAQAELTFGDDGRALSAHGAVQDISHLKAADDAREAALADARRLARAKSEFLANMSHEIRTPLNAVLGFARIGLRENQHRASGVTCSKILQAGEHLLGIINDILDFSKIEAGKLKVESYAFQPAGIVERTLSYITEAATAKGLRISNTQPADLPGWVLGDALRLNQILLNLLGNAVKFTEQGEIGLHLTRDGDTLSFAVVDTGIGMNADELARLFTPFEQADGSTTRKFGGTGLGLAISQQLARLMGGEVHAASTPGQGSTFTLRLPLPATEAAYAADAPPLVPGDGQRLVGLRVLAADDVEFNRILLADLLEHEGATAVFAENGRQAVDRIADEGPFAFDLVLMDVQMPVMGGYEATQRIHALAPHLPVIGLTAHALAEEREKSLAAGMRDHVTKPIDNDELVASILRHTTPKPAPQLPDVVQPAIAAATPAASDAVSIDWNALDERFNGRQAFIDKLLGMICASHADAPARLRAAALGGNHQEMAFLAHSIKGSAGSIKAGKVQETARLAEESARNGRADAAQRAEGLAGEVEALLAALAARLGKPAP